MKKIHKYNLGVGEQTIVCTDRFKEILHVANQPGEGPQMWAMVDDDAKIKTIEVRCVGTGWPIPFDTEDFEFIGTVIEDTGYVWHYFMRQIVAAECAMAGPIILAMMAEAETETACAA